MLSENIKDRVMFFMDVIQIASTRMNNINDIENLFIKVSNLFYCFEDFIEVNDFDILSLLGNVGQ
ncbi:MAG: hypothetical protein QXT38_04165 [Candidatus Aenigmatarchaeota archaeon]